MISTNGWTLAGTIFVDSGSVMVGDPCYTQGSDTPDHSASWDEFLKTTWPKDFADGTGASVYDEGGVNARGKHGVGLVFGSGYGDGEYHVYYKTMDGKRTSAIMVVFDDEDSE